MGHFALFEIFITLISFSYEPPILERFWKNSTQELTITLPPVYLYKLYISEVKIIKRKLLTQSEAKSFFQQKCEHRSSRNIQTGTLKLR